MVIFLFALYYRVELRYTLFLFQQWVYGSVLNENLPLSHTGNLYIYTLELYLYTLYSFILYGNYYTYTIRLVL